MGENIYLTVCSEIFGWIYFFSWSCSWYPQIYLNCKRKSVRGISFDFQLYNFTGCLAYLLYCLIIFIAERRRHVTPTININDLAFAGHGFFATCLTILQIFVYDRDDQVLSKVAVQLTVLLWAVAIYNVTLLSPAGVIPYWQRIGYSSTSYLGYAKGVTSLVKCIPQVWMNFQDKTTQGFSIGNAILSFTGGIFSLGQQVIDSFNKNNWTILFGNIPKLLLALQSIGFDTIFFLQHYCLYGPEKDRPMLIVQGRTWRRTDREPVHSASIPAVQSAGELREPLIAGR